MFTFTFRNISPRRKIFQILCCNITSNKPFQDFLDSKLCRIFPRRRWNRLEHASLQTEAAQKKDDSRIIFWEPEVHEILPMSPNSVGASKCRNAGECHISLLRYIVLSRFWYTTLPIILRI